MSGAPIPAAVRGTNFDGLAHLSDVYATVAVGFGAINPAALRATGPIAPDGYNLWPALSTGGRSPRSEVLHLPLTEGMPKGLGINASLCLKADTDGETPGGHGCAPSLRMGKYKLLFNFPGADDLWTLDPVVMGGVPYGRSGGIVYPAGSDHAIGPHWKSENSTRQHGCLPLGNSTVLEAPCLYDVEADPSELRNLNLGGSTDPAIVAIVKNMTSRLMTASATAAPFADIVDPATYQPYYVPFICAAMHQTGFWLPVDWNGTQVPPAPPALCHAACVKACPGPFTTPQICLTCTRMAPAIVAMCSPKDRQAYCNATVGTATSATL